MKTKNLIVIIMILLASCTQAVEPPMEAMSNVSGSYPRSEAPDFFADGKFFNDMYSQNVTTISRSWAADYPADAKVYYQEYINRFLSSERSDIPDYPLDGKFFVEYWTETP